ncbi:MAG: exodeoxyribonuclease V subunit alpha [Thermodesulfobacteriota bacterium]
MDRLPISDFYYLMFQDLKDEYGFIYLDYYFSKLMIENESDEKTFSLFFFMYLSMQTRKGSVCTDIQTDQSIARLLKRFEIDHDKFVKEIKNSLAVGPPDSEKPVIYEENKFYLNRYYIYEKFFSDWIINKSLLDKSESAETGKFKKILDKYFSDDPSQADMQKLACISASFSDLCVISGGPGTGKTTTLVKIIAVLLELEYPENLNIKICAPTGKAASRLGDAIKNLLSELEIDEAVKDLIPDKARTIHRLLKYNPESGFFYNRENRLRADVMIVDEASMIDLKLMNDLCSALEDDCRLILSGDRFQLASVSPGSVFGDICKRGEKIWYSENYLNFLEKFFDKNFLKEFFSESKRSFADSITELKKNYRFGANSGIAELAKSIKNSDAKRAFDVLGSDQYKDVVFIETGPEKDFKQLISTFTDNYYASMLQASDPEEAFEKFSEFMILSPLKQGSFGVKKINEIAENRLFQGNEKSKSFLWYNGKPVMINSNDYRNNLFNGDIGICLDIKNSKNKKIYFQSDKSGFLQFHSSLLNNYDSVFSMSVHKSQGSEFDNILLVLPEHYSEVLSRELVYTAVTRARKKVFICGRKDVFKFAVNKSHSRESGLYNRIWKK